LNNILNNSITVNSDINNIKATLPSFLLINNFTGSINNYLRIDNFNGSINNYLRIDNFNGSINSYLRIDNFTGSINSYLRIDNFNSSITTYLKTVDFNNTSINFVNTSNAQTINGNKSFNNLVKFKGSDNIIGGEPSIQIMPKDGNSGQSFWNFIDIQTVLCPCLVINGLWAQIWKVSNYLPRRSFSIWASSLNFRSPHLYITSY
jgi:hypothetical protein